jgi:hypothetical protein
VDAIDGETNETTDHYDGTRKTWNGVHKSQEEKKISQKKVFFRVKKNGEKKFFFERFLLINLSALLRLLFAVSDTRSLPRIKLFNKVG